MRFVAFIVVVAFLLGCKKSEEALPGTSGTAVLEVPEGFPQPVIPLQNPMTHEKAALGKKLFFDPLLSVNGRVSCATCHLPVHAFADGEITSVGVSGNRLERHSPPLFNLAWIPELFWDGGAKNLESLVFAPITHPDEMGETLINVTNKLNHTTEYKSLFKQAFDVDTASSASVAWALAAYMRTLVSAGSKYDDYRLGKSALSANETKGMALYEIKCASCHPAPLFTDNDFHQILPPQTPDPGNEEDLRLGRQRVTHRAEDFAKFKTPSLRNLGYTAPYMHTGQYPTLHDAIAAHANSILSNEETTLIIDFLNTLNDSKFIDNNAIQ